MSFKIINKNFMYCFLILPFLKPFNIILIPNVNNIFNIWKILSTCTIIFLYFLNLAKRQFKIQKTFLWGYLFLVTWYISLIINSSNDSDIVNNILSIFSFLLLSEVFSYDTAFIENLFKILYMVSNIYIICNFITVLFNKPLFNAVIPVTATYDRYFLGGDNYSAFILIPLCTFIFFYNLFKFGRIKVLAWIIALIGDLCLIIPLSYTGFFAYSVFLIAILAINFPKTIKIFNYKNMLLLNLFILITVSIGETNYSVNQWLSSIGKEGLNGRNLIWPEALHAIYMKPLMGYGGLKESQYFLLNHIDHTHNIILQYFFSTGLIGTLFFSKFFSCIISESKKIYNDKSLRILLMGLAATILCSTFDFYIGLIWFYIHIICIKLYVNYKSQHSSSNLVRIHRRI